jgi:hypothetical protein
VLFSRDVTRQNDKGDRHDRCDDLLHNVFMVLFGSLAQSC